MRPGASLVEGILRLDDETGNKLLPGGVGGDGTQSVTRTFCLVYL